MGLPSELRIAIFEYLLPRKTIKYDCKFGPGKHADTNRVTVSRETSTEIDREGNMLRSVPPSAVWEPTYLALLRTNRQCNIEASSTLYTRTRTLSLAVNGSEPHDDQNPMDDPPTSLMDLNIDPEECRGPYVWFWDQGLVPTITRNGPGYCNGIPTSMMMLLLDKPPGTQGWLPQFSKLGTLELTISPRNLPGYWYAIQSSMTLLLHEHLGTPPKNLIIKLFDMSRNTYDSMTHSQTIPNARNRNLWTTISATFEDYMETLQLFQHAALKAENCQIFLPYWMEAKFQATALKRAWDASSGVKVCFMPLGAWANPTEYITTLDRNTRLPKLAYQTPVHLLHQNERSWSALAWSSDKEAPEENFDESRVREGYFFLADLD